jgi:hypothetical protein
MEINVLSKKEVVALAKQQNYPDTVKLVSIDFNWGPPISGRFDTDRMNLWAKVKNTEKGKLYMQGKNLHGNWDIHIPLQKIGSYKENDSENKFTLYNLSLNDSSKFPVEFVLRYETESGNKYYDNNNGRNYVLTPYQQYGSSVICADSILFDLGEIKYYKMYRV